MLWTVRSREVPTPSAVAWVEHGVWEPVVALEDSTINFIVFVTEQAVVWKGGRGSSTHVEVEMGADSHSHDRWFARTHPFRVRPNLLADPQSLEEELQRGGLELLLRGRRDLGRRPAGVGLLHQRDREVAVGGGVPAIAAVVVVPIDGLQFKSVLAGY